MSSMAAALFLALAASTGPMPDGRVAGTTAVARMCANDNDPSAIVVCAEKAAPSPRLPMRDDRAEPGEDVRYLTDGLRQDPGPPGEPSRLGETIVKLFKGAKSLVTGEDPGY
jgi:hypothetical protein